MLEKIYTLEKELSKYLTDIGEWKSVYVDYHKPYVKRLWKQVGELRVYLHQISPCEMSESLLHPHPWPSAMKVVEGTYEMGVGYSKTNEAPVIASKLILPQGSYYEMADINSWHYVRPLTSASFSLMITGTPWGREVPKSPHKLPELSTEEQLLIFNKFKKYYEKKK